MKKIIFRIIIVIMCIIAIILIENLFTKDFAEGYEGQIETTESLLYRASWMLFVLNVAFSTNRYISTIENVKDFKIHHLIIPVLFIINAIVIAFTSGIYVELIFISINGISTILVLKKT